MITSKALRRLMLTSKALRGLKRQIETLDSLIVDGKVIDSMILAETISDIGHIILDMCELSSVTPEPKSENTEDC